MIKANQFQCKFLPEEDRLLLKVNTVDKQEFHFLLTRRYVKLLLPTITKLLESNDKNIKKKEKAATLKHQHQQALKQADFSKSFEPTKNNDIKTILAQSTTFKKNEKAILVHIEDSSKNSIDMVFDRNMMHSLHQLLSDGSAMADWDILAPSLFHHDISSQTKH